MESELNLTEVPKKVKQASNLVYLSLVLGLIKMVLYEILTSQKMLTQPKALTIGIITIAILAFFGFKIGEGKNWARITFLVLFIIGIISFPFSLLNEFKMSPIIGIASVIQMLIQLYILIILFTGESKEWFSKNKSE
nr:hypothetical protein [uncultured Flavobacterium sp.]